MDKFAGLLRFIAEASMQTISPFQEHKHSNSRCKGGSPDTRDTICPYLYNDDYCLVRYNDIIQNVDLHGTTIIGNFTAWSDAAARCSIMVISPKHELYNNFFQLSQQSPGHNFRLYNAFQLDTIWSRTNCYRSERRLRKWMGCLSEMDDTDDVPVDCHADTSFLYCIRKVTKMAVQGNFD